MKVELSESTASGCVTAEWLMKRAINQQENVRPVVEMGLPASAVRSVSHIHSQYSLVIWMPDSELCHLDKCNTYALLRLYISLIGTVTSIQFTLT